MVVSVAVFIFNLVGIFVFHYGVVSGKGCLLLGISEQVIYLSD